MTYQRKRKKFFLLQSLVAHLTIQTDSPVGDTKLITAEKNPTEIARDIFGHFRLVGCAVVHCASKITKTDQTNVEP